MIGTYFWWMHLYKQDSVPVDDVIFTEPTTRPHWGFRRKETPVSDEEQGNTTSSTVSVDERAG